MAISEDDLVRLARQTHSNWLELMEGRGYHPSSFCSFFGKGCPKCNPDMVPFDDLSPEVREGYSSRVKILEESLSELGYLILAPHSLRAREGAGAILEEETPESSGTDDLALRRLPAALSTYRPR